MSDPKLDIASSASSSFFSILLIQRIVPKEAKQSIGRQSKEINSLLYFLFCVTQ